VGCCSAQKVRYLCVVELFVKCSVSYEVVCCRVRRVGCSSACKEDKKQAVSARLLPALNTKQTHKIPYTMRALFVCCLETPIHNTRIVCVL